MGIRPGEIFPSLPTSPQPSDVPSPVPQQDADIALEQMDIEQLKASQAQQPADASQVFAEPEPGTPPMEAAEQQLGVDVGGIEQRLLGDKARELAVRERFESRDYDKPDRPYSQSPRTQVTPEKINIENKRRQDGAVNRYMQRISNQERAAGDRFQAREDLKADDFVLQSADDFDREMDQFMVGLGGEPEFAEPGRFELAEEEFAGLANPRELIRRKSRDFLARFKSGLARSDEEAINGIASVFGPENVIKKEGKIFVRRGPGEKFTPLDPDQWEFFNDIVVDNSGAVIEGITSAAVESLAVMGAAAVTTGTGGVAAPAVAAAVPSGLALGGLAGVGAREGTMRALDALSDQVQRDEDVDLWNESLWAMGGNLVFGGLGTAFTFGLSKMLKASGDLAEATVKNAAVTVQTKAGPKQVSGRAVDRARAEKAFEEYARNLGFSKEFIEQSQKRLGPANGNVELEEGVRNVYGAFQRFKESHEASAKLLNREAIELGGDATFEMPGLEKMLRDTLADWGVTFNKEGLASLPSSALKGRKAGAEDVFREGLEEGETAIAELISEATNPSASGVAGKAPKVKSIPERFAFGSESGPAFLKSLIEDYNSLVRGASTEGGVTAREAINVVQKYQEVFRKGEFQKMPINDKQSAVLKKIQHIAGEDRDEIFETIFTGTPLEAEWKGMRNEFVANIDAIKGIFKTFGSEQPAGEWARMFMKPGNIVQIRQLKSILGPESQQWLTLRNTWIDDLFQKSTGSAKEIRPEVVKQRLKEFTDLERRTLLSNKEEAALIRFAENVVDIPFDDLVNTPKLRSIIKDGVVLFGNSLSTTKGDILANWLLKNDRVTPEIFELLKKEAFEAPQASVRKNIMSMLRHLQGIVDNSNRVTIIRKHPKTGKRVPTTMWIPGGTTAAQTQFVKETRREAIGAGLESEEEKSARQKLIEKAEQQQMEFGDIQ
jgi:hypothetical protein